MTALSTRPLSGALGVEVDVDLATAFDDDMLAELEVLFTRHHLLLFRHQNLPEEAQVRFARHFGPISHRSPAMRKTDSVMVSNTAPGGILGNGVLHFHSDNTFFAHPLKAIGLYAITVPQDGGDTIYSNVRLAYDNLPTALKDRIEGLTSHQVFDFAGDYNHRTSLETTPPDAQRAKHPLVWVDPDSGARALFFSELTTARIEGIAVADEEDLIAELRGYIADPAVTYRHRWPAGDFLFWDNIVLQHARTDFDPRQERTLRRTPVLDPDGDRRFPHSVDATQRTEAARA